MHAAHTVSDACPVSGCALLPTRVCVVRGYAPCAGTRRAQIRAVLNYAPCMDTRHARLAVRGRWYAPCVVRAYAPCASGDTPCTACPSRRGEGQGYRVGVSDRGPCRLPLLQVYRGLANLAKANELRLEQAEMPLFLEAAECMPGPVGSVSVLGSVMFKMRGVI